MHTRTTATEAEDLYADLVVADGMRSGDQWEALDVDGRVAWVAELVARGPLFVRAQASVFALDAGRTVRQILNDWQHHGYISREQAAAALRAEVR